MKKPKFKGPLARRIVFAEPEPFDFKSPEWRQWRERQHAAVFQARMDKLWLLAKHANFEVDYNAVDLRTVEGQMLFYRQMALRLALVYVPGFLEKDLLKERTALWLAQIIDYGKTTPGGKHKTDFQILLQHVKDQDPEMKRSANSGIAKSRARTLRNRVSAARVALKRKAEEEARKQAQAERKNTVH